MVICFSDFKYLHKTQSHIGLLLDVAVMNIKKLPVTSSALLPAGSEAKPNVYFIRVCRDWVIKYCTSLKSGFDDTA